VRPYCVPNSTVGAAEQHALIPAKQNHYRSPPPTTTMSDMHYKRNQIIQLLLFTHDVRTSNLN
jgi:hypothetical protein